MPYAPGGATDITSRLFGEQFKNILGQQVVVENKPGAFGILAIEEMANSKPDGYTLFIGNVSTNAITPVLFKNKFQIDFEKTVVSVSRLAIYPSFLVTTAANFDAKTVKDVVDFAKKNPGKVRYTSAGVGSFPHFDMEVFSRRAGIEMIHIPNKTGAAGMINDLVVGDAQVAFLNAASSASMIKAGKLRPVAVLAEARLKDYPDVPTMAEVGFPDVGTLHWQACSRLPPRRSRCWRRCSRRSRPRRRSRHSRRPSASSSSASSRTSRSLKRRLAQRRACQVAQDHRRGKDRFELKHDCDSLNALGQIAIAVAS